MKCCSEILSTHHLQPLMPFDSCPPLRLLHSLTVPLYSTPLAKPPPPPLLAPPPEAISMCSHTLISRPSHFTPSLTLSHLATEAAISHSPFIPLLPPILHDTSPHCQTPPLTPQPQLPPSPLTITITTMSTILGPCTILFCPPRTCLHANYSSPGERLTSLFGVGHFLPGRQPQVQE